MVSQSHTKGRSRNAQGVRGFTLLEVMMVTLISSFVFAGVLSAYIFLGRGLSRQVNAEGLESRTRLALSYFTQDVSSASSITAQNPGTQTTGNQMVLSIPGLSSTVTYKCDWSGGTAAGILERQVGSSGPWLVLLKNLTSFGFQYFDSTTHSITVPTVAPTSPQNDIKQVCMTYTSSAGYAPSGNVSQFTVVSPLVILKNKGLLTDPNTP
jgi:prepilin-type N-terminal cleavage/methylation domain-containing protein